MNGILRSRRCNPANHPRCCTVTVQPACFEAVNIDVGVVNRTAVLITDAIAVGISERDCRRLALQDKLCGGLTDRTFLNSGCRPPMSCDICLVDHGVGHRVNGAGEGGIINRAVTNPFSSVEDKREIGGPFEIYVSMDRETLSDLKFFRRPRTVHADGRRDVSAGRGYPGDFGGHLVTGSGGRRHFDTRRLSVVDGRNGFGHSLEKEHSENAGKNRQH